ncbi:hypothetical protein H6H03_20275 [Nostoc paludosum FACHB-159]|uniref:Uncharacterized protein n=1 Tax=Nostoc paludosum FACHB-159 TaxID=2692908 RepID=A0ABR8KBN8_9NOSO|nr:hypothetical protein [Nostoc paludosum FACHB-159]
MGHWALGIGHWLCLVRSYYSPLCPLPPLLPHLLISPTPHFPTPFPIQ